MKPHEIARSFLSVIVMVTLSEPDDVLAALREVPLVRASAGSADEVHRTRPDLWLTSPADVAAELRDQVAGSGTLVTLLLSKRIDRAALVSLVGAARDHLLRRAPRLPLCTAVRLTERDMVRVALMGANGSVSEAARRLGVTRQALQGILRRAA